MILIWLSFVRGFKRKLVNQCHTCVGLALLLLFIGGALQALVSIAPVFEAERLLAANPTAALAEAVQTDNHEPEATSHSQEEHGRPIDVYARLFNFSILVGTLFFFLRSPIGAYVRNRGSQVRNDLADAKKTNAAARQQLKDIEEKAQAFPAELEAMRSQGKKEIEVEAQRLRESTETERDRLVEQKRREIDLQVRVAKRELVQYASELVVGVAAGRIREEMNDADQLRLIDRYLNQINPQ